ncbi:MAG TPA: tetratricopeptide repeat protein [Pyrinomonadaceae bacterium]|jgi:tetratricopeptide (TPR) repeat protein
MSLQNLYFSFRKFSGVSSIFALVLCFSAFDASAQPGSGRITPTTGAAKKKVTTITKKTTTTTVKKATTSSRNVIKRTTNSKVKNFDYYYNLGLSLYGQGDLPGAIANYTQAIKLNPSSADAFYNRGLAYYDSKSYASAVNDYSQSIRISPQADAYNNRGLAYEKNGNRAQAIADYQTAVRLKPDYELAQDNLDRLNGNTGGGGTGGGSAGNGSAGGGGGNTNSNSTEDSEYYAQLADDYYDKRDFDNAMINYTKAINLAPREAGSYVRRGFIYHYTGEIGKAYADYETAVKYDPSLKSEPYIQCMLYSEANDEPSTGINICTKTITEFPTFSLAYYKRGVAYRVQKSYDLALKDFTKSIEYYPQFFNSYIYRALIYAATDRNSLALTDYTKAIQIAGVNDPKASLAYYNRGLINEDMGNYSAAAADYRKSYQLDSSYTPAKTRLDEVLKKQRGTN